MWSALAGGFGQQATGMGAPSSASATGGTSTIGGMQVGNYTGPGGINTTHTMLLIGAGLVLALVVLTRR